MSRRISTRIDVDGPLDRDRLADFVHAADDGGVETLFVPETWGRDAFSLLVWAATFTRRVKLATGIVNVYSRTPAALAQHFATLDELSDGRAIAGLGTSGVRVIEHFHGVPFQPSATRLRETIRVMKTIFAGEPLHFEGRVFNLQRGFTLRHSPGPRVIPIYLASFRPAGVAITAELGDGWLPLMIPLDRVAGEVDRIRNLAVSHGRPSDCISVVSPGHVTVTNDPDRAMAGHRRTLAFYIARMGEYYAANLADMGWADNVAAVRAAWDSGASAAGAAAIDDRLAASLFVGGSIEACAARLDEQSAAGVDVHRVTVAGVEDRRGLTRIFERLVG
jgi:alkanesulfonate monooxygenase SsuD/methylene tetrahydromethanopterin reductase-like flavin-dependent oxidoreductase (luciferase family)